jgi:hypothetical protein
MKTAWMLSASGSNATASQPGIQFSTRQSYGRFCMANTLSKSEKSLDLISKEEVEGVKMIQALLEKNGQTEPVAVSLANWRGFCEGTKEATRRAYEIVVLGI